MTSGTGQGRPLIPKPTNDRHGGNSGAHDTDRMIEETRHWTRELEKCLPRTSANPPGRGSSVPIATLDGFAPTLGRSPGIQEKRTGTAENSVGDRHEPCRLFVLTCTGAELPSQSVDLRIQVLDPIEQKGVQLTDRTRQPRTWILEGRCQPIDTSPPCGATTPNSARWPRNALIIWVRWRTRRSRVWNNIPLACCSSVFTATKRIVGRCAASQHAPDYVSGLASASAASFFCRFTNGLT